MADRMTEVRYRTINENTAGAHQQVVVPAGYQFLLVGLALSAAGAVLVTFQDTATLMDRHLTADGNGDLGESDVGWFRGNTAQNLSIALDANVAVGGVMAYRLVPEHLEL